MAEAQGDKRIGRLVLLSGPIGAGKTAVSQELVNLLPGPLVCIEGDTFWVHFQGTKGVGPHKALRAAMRAMVSAAVSYALSGFDVILDFTIPPWFLDTVKKIAGMRSVPLDYVVYMPSEAVCAQRASSRELGKIENYDGEFYADFKDSPTPPVEDDGSGPTAVAVAIAEGLSQGRFHLLEDLGLPRG